LGTPLRSLEERRFMVEAQHAGASPPTAQAKGSPREIFPGSVGDGVAAHTFGPAAVCKAVTRTSSYPDYEELNGEYHCRCAIMRS
jgi:hypothetical protein